MKKIKTITTDDLFKAAWSRMYNAVDAYYLWKQLEIAININNKGKAVAEKNVSIMNDYSYLFLPLFPITYKSFIVDLAVFFDQTREDDSFSLKKLVSSLKDKISEDKLKALRTEIEKIKKSHGVTISLIQELRNADVAHQKIVPVLRKLKYSEIEGLIIAVQEILNLISHLHNDFFTIWDNVEDQVINDLQRIFNNLERGEKGRLEEIEREYRE